MKRMHSLGIITSVLVTFFVVTQNSPSHAQTSGKRAAAPPPKSEAESSPDTSSLLEKYGYNVQIPEMKMNQIKVGSKSKAPVSAPVQATPLKSAPVPDKIVIEEASVQPAETPKPPEAQQPAELVKVTSVEKKSESPTWTFGNISDYNFIKLPDKLEVSGTFLMSLMFILVAAAGFSAKDGYVVIRDKKGVCRVIKSRKKTSSTIAGPFRTKEIARKAMEKGNLDPSPALMNLPARDFVQIRLPIRCCKIVPSRQPTTAKVTSIGTVGLPVKPTPKRKTGFSGGIGA